MDNAPAKLPRGHSSILIHNIYVMLAYGFSSLEIGNLTRGNAESFEHIHEVFAHLLAREVSPLAKRGIDHGYIDQCERISTVRGRINVGRTAASGSLLRGQLVCEFDDYSPNTAPNQAIKTAITPLAGRGLMRPSRRRELSQLLPYFDAVHTVSPHDIDWAALRAQRLNRRYQRALGLSELVLTGLLPSTTEGSTLLNEWFSDEQISAIYERFLLEYYRAHHPQLKAKASHVNWALSGCNQVGINQLPLMRTDVTLRSPTHTLIVDAKFYSSSMQRSRWGKETLHSGHLYQLLSYVLNESARQPGRVSGLLLYAATNSDQQPDVDVTINGMRVGAKALDLSKPWACVQEQLESVLDWMD